MTNSRAGKTLINIGTAQSLTIASGVITFVRTGSFLKIDGEGASADDLVTINGGVEGDIIVCSAQSSARDITFKNGTGNILLDNDWVTVTTQEKLMLLYTSSNWHELSWAKAT